MKSRQDIKALAKEAFLGNYWLCVGVNVVVIAVISAAASLTLGLGSLIIMGPMMIGLGFFSLCLYRGQSANFDSVFSNGFSNFGRKLGGFLWMELFVFLWSLLLVVPGIIKGFAYAMTPYILADCPEVKAQDALKISIRMMHGHKADLFVFCLSFLGWALLSGLTCGLLHIFYVGPYMNNALAGFYAEIKANALVNGVVSEEELNGFAPAGTVA